MTGSPENTMRPSVRRGLRKWVLLFGKPRHHCTTAHLPTTQKPMTEGHKVKFKNVAVISVAATVSAVALGTGAAQAAGLIGSAGIRDDSVRSVDIKDQTLRTSDMAPAAVQDLKGQK